MGYLKENRTNKKNIQQSIVLRKKNNITWNCIKESCGTVQKKLVEIVTINSLDNET